MKKFTFTGAYEGKTINLNDRYRFVDGEMVCDDDTAAKISPILCGFYACTMSDVINEAASEHVEDGEDDSSLSPEVTRTGK